MYHRPRLTGNRSSGGVIVAIKNSIESEEIELETTLEALAVKVGSPFNTNVLNVYLPPNEEIELPDLSALIQQVPKPVLLIGDLNAHHPLWGSDHHSERGLTVVDFIEANNLTLLNNGEPTYVSKQHGTFSCLDLAICSDELAGQLEWSVAVDAHSSDHMPITVTFPGKINSHQNRPRWRIEKANWEQYQSALNFTREDDVERQVESITKTILDAAEVSIPRTKGVVGEKCVPWWNDQIAKLVKIRRKALRQLKANRTDHDQLKTAFIEAHNNAKIAITAAKTESWKELANSFTSQTPLKEMWGSYRKIQGKIKSTQISSIQDEGKTATDPASICEFLGNAFERVSSNTTYSVAFQQRKQQIETTPLEVPEEAGSHNQQFTRYELEEALEGLKGSSPGPDNIHYAMITHLPIDGKLVLLETYNRLWVESVYPTAWTKSLVVPIFKGKGQRSDPQNYRPIYLNSCLGKVFERMVNNRLIHLLESKGLLHPHQYAFRKGKSTTDHLCTLEETLRETFCKNKIAQVAFLDVSKAYDTTWRRLCLQQLKDGNIGGKMLRFLQEMLCNRSFQVTTGGKTSSEKIMQTGLCQGSVLSVTMFLVAINTITNHLPPNIKCLIYADDVILIAIGDDALETESRLQTAFNQIESWEELTGFKVSAAKCATVIFRSPRTKKPKNPNNLKLNGIKVPRKKSHKCLGIVLDQHLKYNIHAEEVKAVCQQRVQFLRSIATRSWGGDRNTLTKLYRATVLEKFLYSAPILSGMDEKVLNSLETVHNTGLRAITGAFRTSPITSLQIETGIPSLKTLFEQRTTLYAVRRMALDHTQQVNDPRENTTSDENTSCSSENGESSDERWSEQQRCKPNSFMDRGKHLLTELEIHLPRVKIFKIPQCPPWLRSKIIVDRSLHLKLTQGATFSDLKYLFNERRQTKYRIHRAIFTDGSKQGSKCGFGMVCEQYIFRKRLDNVCSIYAAESVAVEYAFKWIVNQKESRAYLLCTDSMSVISSLEKCKIKSSWKDNLQILHNQIIEKGSEVVICWVPGHAGILGNERADQEAKRALDLPEERQQNVDFNEIRKVIKSQIMCRWQAAWHGMLNNKLREVKDTVRPFKSGFTNNRQDDVILSRLRIGHTLLTHKYLLDREERPLCTRCNETLTVKHIIVNCAQLENERSNCGIPANLREALADDKDMAAKVIEFMKAIQLYDRI